MRSLDNNFEFQQNISFMMPSLDEILFEDRVYFDEVCISKQLSESCTAYCCPESDEVYYWNLVYPHSADHKYTIEELEAAQSYYASQKRTGYLLADYSTWAPLGADHAESHILMANNQIYQPATSISVHEGNDIKSFRDISQKAYNHNDATMDHLANTVERLSHNGICRYFIAVHKGIPCGSIGTMKTEHGWTLLFSISVLPEMQNKGICTSLLAHVLPRIAKPCFGFSINESLRNHIFPRFGFETRGNICHIPLSTYIERAPHLKANR